MARAWSQRLVRELHTVLAEAGHDLSALELAEVLWLASRVTPPPRAPGAGDRLAVLEPPVDQGVSPEPANTSNASGNTRPASEPVYPQGEVTGPGTPARPIRVPSAAVLPDPLALLRALRPLKRRVPSRRASILDEEATARRIAEHGVRLPVLRPAPGRWLDLVIVADSGSAEQLWLDLAAELRTLCQQLGAFRDVRLRYLHGTGGGPLGLSADADPSTARLHGPATLFDPAGQRLILVLSDCVGRSWQDGSAGRLLARWAGAGPLAILQPLPERLWARTSAPPVRGRLTAPSPGSATARLLFTGYQRRWRTLPPGAVAIPVLGLGPAWLAPWARLVTGQAADATVAIAGAARPQLAGALPAGLSARDLLARFRAAASQEAYALAGYLAVPRALNLAVIRLIQKAMLPGTGPSVLAEILFGGLLVRRASGAGDSYDFPPGVASLLLGTLTQREARQVERQVSEYVEREFHRAGRGFTALFPSPEGEFTVPGDDGEGGFATIRAELLERMGRQPHPGDQPDHLDQLAYYSQLHEEAMAAGKPETLHLAGSRLGRALDRFPQHSPPYQSILRWRAELDLRLATDFGQRDSLSFALANAKNALDHSAEGQPEHQNLLRTYATILSEMATDDSTLGTIDLAIHAIEQVRGGTPGTPLLVRRGELYLQRHALSEDPADRETGITLLSEVRRSHWTLRTVLLLGAALVQIGDGPSLADALDVLHRGLRRADITPEGRTAIGRLLAEAIERSWELTSQLPDPSQALAALDSAPDGVTGLARLSYVMYQASGDLDDLAAARQYAAATTELFPDSDEAWASLGTILAEMADVSGSTAEWVSAREAFGKAIDLVAQQQAEPLGRYLRAYTDLCRKLGRVGDALATVEEFAVSASLTSSGSTQVRLDIQVQYAALLHASGEGRRAREAVQQGLDLLISTTPIRQVNIPLACELLEMFEALAAPGQSLEPALNAAQALLRQAQPRDDETLAHLHSVIALLLARTGQEAAASKAIDAVTLLARGEYGHVAERFAVNLDKARSLLRPDRSPTGHSILVPAAAQSTVVIIGPEFAGSLRAATTATGALDELETLLTEPEGVFGAGRVHRLSDTARDLETRLARLVAGTTDTLLVWYVGEVFFDSRRVLVRSGRGGLNYHWLRQIVRRGKARRVYLVVDHCFGAKWQGREPDDAFLGWDGLASDFGGESFGMFLGLAGGPGTGTGGFPATEAMMAALRDPEAPRPMTYSQLFRGAMERLRRNGTMFRWLVRGEAIAVTGPRQTRPGAKG